ncbi:uracil-DNA glycosylase family protein [Thiobacillus sp.]|uniref:uracil-DNA glycosylase family protein n=1 Tax=Thiobacillus sp. TaxID=924 RepID=UPI0017DC24F0|nr:uracil-DNA glycosylase family protein [Thiobacillus sp.]MBC2732494.1 uracil-DNA glycosylase family protein [Thiobacillus sp.]MBC2741233.1 uracil-DNA glycosylase family protein [Thiobacillus sp.]MBC2761405.1 uracil-DNA glycosylase family protein [Thiobacillus sp.]
MPSTDAFDKLRDRIAACQVCADKLPLAPRPILAVHPAARILIAGQAPGRRAHELGVAWQDASGDRLREWLGLDPAQFYDPRRVALVPMGFCYPGSTASGDRPPRPECSRTWHGTLLPMLKQIRLRVVIGQYAQAYHLGDACGASLTETVSRWRQFAPEMFPLPHPSPRNAIWLKKNPWFTEELLPVLRSTVRALMEDD